MSTCENCIHSSVCTPYNTPNDEYPNIGDCPHFKPKADYVEVVRCGDCKHSRIDDSGTTVCILNSEYDEETGIDYGFLSYHSETDFCSYGERKESEVQGE